MNYKVYIYGIMAFSILLCTIDDIEKNKSWNINPGEPAVMAFIIEKVTTFFQPEGTFLRVFFMILPNTLYLYAFIIFMYRSFTWIKKKIKMGNGRS